MLKKALLALVVGAAAIAPAHAAVVVESSVLSSDPYNFPATFDFNSATPEWNGSVKGVSDPNNSARPVGSTGGFASVGINDAGGLPNPAVLDLSAFGDITEISFLWGSIDTGNKVEFIDADGNAFATFTGGSNGIAPADGNQGSSSIVTFSVTDEHTGLLAGLRFSSTQNAFEFDNVNIQAVPEPATWAMMIAGFGLVGGALRRRSTATLVHA